MAHGLCGSEVRVDFEMLLKTAGICVRELRYEIEHQKHELENAIENSFRQRTELGVVNVQIIVAIKLSGERLAQAADDLKVATDTYSTLLGMYTRSKVVIRNHPHPAYEENSWR